MKLQKTMPAHVNRGIRIARRQKMKLKDGGANGPEKIRKSDFLKVVAGGRSISNPRQYRS